MNRQSDSKRAARGGCPPLFTERLESWGRLRSGLTQVARPELSSHLRGILAARTSKKVLGFGRGLSYGDACINTGNVTVKFNSLDHLLTFDPGKGILTCEAGITLEEIIRAVLPHGWFLPVTPGTCYPTIGGCFAADVHGKNHHVDGSLARHIRWIEILTASGKFARCSRKKDRDLFLATAGGMGLTGLIYRLSLKLKRVHTGYVYAERIRVHSLREMMDVIEVGDADWEYSVSWLDGAAPDREMGRGEIILGRHAEPEQLSFKRRSSPFIIRTRPGISLPVTSPVSLVGSLSTRLFNSLYLRRSGSRRKRREIIPWNIFFYPLDAVREWNRLYGRKGFVQYQFVAPDEAGYSAVGLALQICQRSGHIPSLAVLKRLGEKEGLLSFPMPGWTLALDMPVRHGLFRMLDELDRIVIDHGGRVYLAKDARLSPGSFRAMYPSFPEWLEVKRRVDPEDVFSSDMSRRLAMNREEAD